jgi:kynurenine formamidase
VSARRVVDLSHVVHDGLVTYPGLPPARVATHLSRAASRRRYAAGTEFHIGRVEWVANTGTYLDAPFHRFADGADVADLPLEALVDLEAVVVDARQREQRALAPELLPARTLAGRAVLFHTGWSRHFGTPAYGQGHPYLARATAAALVERGARLVGIDSLNVDGTADGERPVHTALLARGVAIVEHLRGLEQLPREGARFYAAPVAVRGLGSFPVRAFALL